MNHNVSSASRVESKPRGLPFWLRVACTTFILAWGGNQFTSMLVFYRGSGEFADLFVDLMLVIYAAGVAAGLLVAGSLADRIGRRTVTLPLPILSVLGSILIASGEHSEAPMAIGRFVAGLSVGAVMSAGGAWIKELSTLPFDPHAKKSSGAKRASMALTLGLMAGPALAGVLAQWVGLPGQLIYIIHIAITIAVYPLMLGVPETRWTYLSSGGPKTLSVGEVLRDIAAPEAIKPRFLLVVLPIAPWTFGASFTAQAILPSQIQDQLGQPVAFTALVSLITMASGFITQQFGPQIDNEGRRGPIAAMVVSAVGMLLATLEILNPSPVLTLACAVVLGIAYGLCLYIGLAETQRIAAPQHMAALTGIFYTGTYVGMVFPALLTFLDNTFTYPQMLGFGIVMATVTIVLVSFSARPVRSTGQGE